MSKEKICVTGGCGFLGTNLTKLLRVKGYQVTIIDNYSGYPANTEVFARQNYNEVSGLATVVCRDIRDEQIEQAIQGYDIVVHLAAFTNVVESIKNPQECYSVNVNGTLNLLEACRKTGVKKFIFASSNAVMGNQSPPFNEHLNPSPISPMGLSKLIGEKLCEIFCNAYGLDTTVLRFSNCYGKYSRHKGSVIHKFIRQIIKKEPLVIYGDGHQSRDFVYVEDICNALELCINSKETNGEVFHIGSGVETDLNTLTKLFRNITGENIDVVYKPAQQGEVFRNYSEITKARFAFGYIPQWRLERGLKETWGWYKNGI